MANTYSQLYVHIIFAVKHRQSLITPEIKDSVEKYICSIASNNHCKPLSIYCNPDHTHLFVSMKPSVCCSTVIQKIKSSVSLYINKHHLTETHFEWQTGYGVFSYGKSQVEVVCNYIMRQKEHHRKILFKEEYMAFLKAFDVVYDEQYLFEWLF